MTDPTSANMPQIAGTRHGIMILVASVMPVMAIIALVPVLPLLMKEFSGTDGSAFLVPIALTVPALCVALFSPLAGWLSDRLGRKNLLVASLLLYAGFGIIPWFLDDLLQIIGARIALGIVEAIIMTVATVLIGDYFEGERREKWISLQVSAAAISAIVLIAASGALAEALGSRGPFLLYLLAIPAAIAVWLILFEPAVTQSRQEAEGQSFPFAAMLPLVLTTLFVGISFYTAIVQLGPILQISGDVPPIAIGLIGAVCNLAVGLGAFVFHKSGRQAGTGLLALGMVVSALGFAGASVSGSLAMIGAFIVLAYVGSGIMLPNMLTWTMTKLSPQMRGRGMGLWTGAFFLGQFLAPVAATAVTGLTGALATTLMVYAAALAVAAIVAMMVGRRSAPDTRGAPA